MLYVLFLQISCKYIEATHVPPTFAIALLLCVINTLVNNFSLCFSLLYGKC